MLVLPVSSALHRRALRGANFPRTLAGWIDACESSAAPASSNRRDDAAFVPRLDITETDTAYTATLDMPGISKEQLDVSVDERRVVISTATPKTPASGEAPPDAPQVAEAAAPRTLIRERVTPRYARTIVLPQELEAGAAQARMEHGVLTLTLPKRIANGAARVTVQ